MKTLRQIFEDDNGRMSAMRVTFLVFSLGVFAVWAPLSWWSHSMLEIPSTVVTLIGLLAAGKVGQKVTESFTK